jgi:hypothetical protein
MSEIVLKISLDKPALHIDAPPGTDIVLRGFYTTRHDGKVIDAATTSWPKDAPGGASVDPIGFVNLEAGGLHMTSRDIDKHEVHAVVTGKGGEDCSAYGVAAPCLVMDSRPATSRGLTMKDWLATLDGPGIEAVLPEPPVVPIAPSAVPYLGASAGIALAAIAVAVGWRWKKRRDASPVGQMLALARSVKERLGRADQVLAAPLAPAVDAAIRALRDKRVDPGSAEGKRVAAALRRVDERLEASVREERAAKEQEAADELVLEMESALEAADEVKRAHAP